ncbi:hypothetical protein K502DRAFT_364985 [Neoconidiobolus thromboides FSU 785]|nr:hypothetical protein K502DRAFT_364985 [Neoconidiobolus thromboides FSU 785]
MNPEKEIQYKIQDRSTFKTDLEVHFDKIYINGSSKFYIIERYITQTQKEDRGLKNKNKVWDLNYLLFNKDEIKDIGRTSIKTGKSNLFLYGLQENNGLIYSNAISPYGLLSDDSVLYLTILTDFRVILYKLETNFMYQKELYKILDFTSIIYEFLNDEFAGSLENDLNMLRCNASAWSKLLNGRMALIALGSKNRYTTIWSVLDGKLTFLKFVKINEDEITNLSFSPWYKDGEKDHCYLLICHAKGFVRIDIEAPTIPTKKLEDITSVDYYPKSELEYKIEANPQEYNIDYITSLNWSSEFQHEPTLLLAKLGKLYLFQFKNNLEINIDEENLLPILGFEFLTENTLNYVTLNGSYHQIKLEYEDNSPISLSPIPCDINLIRNFIEVKEGHFLRIFDMKLSKNQQALAICYEIKKLGIIHIIDKEDNYDILVINLNKIGVKEQLYSKLDQLDSDLKIGPFYSICDFFWNNKTEIIERSKIMVCRAKTNVPRALDIPKRTY